MHTNGYRRLVIRSVTDSWQLPLPAAQSGHLLLSDRFPQADAQLSRYRDYLGHEFDQVTIDCREQLHVDAIAALSGTVVAGGQLQLLTGSTESPMLRRLRSNWAEPTAPAPPLPRLPTPEQQQLSQHLRDTKTTHLLLADRGRGKSHTLGQAVARQLQQHPQQRLLVTAPRKANAKVLLQSAPAAQFVAWDKLLAEQKGDALLVIDEAAGIPLWATQRLCQLYRPWLLATTINGYEGCGKGFAVHFTDWAQQQFAAVRFHRLDTPIRWPAGDPLEHWLEQALLLTPAPPTLTHITSRQTVHASSLPDDALHQAFELLLQAHYQSSPNDLALLLNDPHQFLTLEYQDNRVVGVTWSALEGPLPEPIRDAIVTGKRRPKGNLLPQAIGYFLQQRWALSHKWCRVVRIAVADAYRRQGIASQLLQRVKQWATQQQCQFIGTSFGFSQALGAFWQYNDFHAVRTSTALDRVSARHQHIMACCLHEPVEQWSALLEYGAAERDWVLHKRLQPLTDNTVVAAIEQGFRQGYLPRASAEFALNVR
ncbi:tRNA cytosine(34) acetyltransferase TmcA [Idiomarina sp. OT37-5b]|uniref:GNAT family N-acetyltransferase n=1 Tax=Idiomarina sp. OT37-5b TaxID=2100422 RepID=UPI000CFA5EB1|nr:GNAT family N-acetyltransferase [Idiomarina sp. OT37-5b]AVJ56590.1 tRNA cytosine(34) acetyltransferase TmcA [Idiomarina sp. OT37-5b]